MDDLSAEEVDFYINVSLPFFTGIELDHGFLIAHYSNGQSSGTEILWDYQAEGV